MGERVWHARVAHAEVALGPLLLWKRARREGQSVLMYRALVTAVKEHTVQPGKLGDPTSSICFKTTWRRPCGASTRHSYQ